VSSCNAELRARLLFLSSSRERLEILPSMNYGGDQNALLVYAIDDAIAMDQSLSYCGVL